MWLGESNSWIYPHLHNSADRMVELAREYKDCNGIVRRALNQAARELMLAQSSDWAFIMETGTMAPYARKRILDHLSRFNRLYSEVKSGAIDEDFLSDIESRDNIFPDVDYRVYS